MNSNLVLESLKFRLHVRDLLYDYFKRNCAKDYLRFTEDLFSEFVEDLRQVPFTDPYSLTIPVDPFDTLQDLYSHLPSAFPEQQEGSDDAQPIPSETVVKYLKGALFISVGRPKTDLIVEVDSYGPPPPEEVLYPVLTRRTRRATKVLGQKDVKEPATLPELFKSQNIGAAMVEVVQEPEVDFEDTLQLKLLIEPEELPAVRTLLHNAMDTSRRSERSSCRPNKHLDPVSLRKEFPPEEPRLARTDDEVFVPIFSRRRRHRRSGTAAAAASAVVVTPTGTPYVNFKSLVENQSAPFKSVEVVDPDGDIHRQNLLVVDGWETIRSSPAPSTPSSKAGNEIDELEEEEGLQFPSSPNTTPPRIRELHDTKMDEVLIPRSRRIGGTHGVPPHILSGKTLQTFLGPLLGPPPPQQLVPTAAQDALERISSPTTPSSSLLGQPSRSILLNVDHRRLTDADLEPELSKLYDGQDLDQNFVLEETLDDGDDGHALLLMEVPSLPQPTEFPKDFILPTSLSDFVVVAAPMATTEKLGNLSLPPRRFFLKKVRGCQSLSLELSWVPFMTDRQLPTALEVVDASSVVVVADDDPESESARLFLDSVLLPGTAAAAADSSDLPEVCVRRGLEVGRDDPVFLAKAEHEEEEEYLVLLNRQEKDRLLGLHGGRMDDSGERSDTLEGDDDEPLKGSRLDDDDLDLDFSFDSRGGLVPASCPELALRTLGIAAFAQLRGKKISYASPSKPVLAPPSPSPALALPTEPPERPPGPPEEICDANTIRLGDNDNNNDVRSPHRYMASLDFIQKRAIVLSLRRECAVELVERQTLGGVDLIIDADAAVVFVNLFLLPSRGAACLDNVARQSWKFRRLLVVFEAYEELDAKRNARAPFRGSTAATTAAAAAATATATSSALAVDRDDGGGGGRSRLYAYTPPIVKALKKFKRDVQIAEGCGTKRVSMSVQYAYADTVKEAALFVRTVGDWMEAAADVTRGGGGGGVLWGERLWLDADYSEEEERSLASLNGLNHFSASIVLCQITLQQFVDLTPEERLSAFGCYINPEDIAASSDDLESRLVVALQAVHNSSGTLEDVDML